MTTQHILLTALGKVQQSTFYELHGRAVKEPLAPLALLRLLPQGMRPNRVLALCTEGARHATWETFANGVRQTLQVEAERLDIPDGKTADEIRQIVETAAEQFPEGAELTLDVTQGLRHFPFVAYALAVYLTSLRGIRLRGAYYGMLEAFARDSEEPRPIVDIRPLLDLPEWFHAVRVFRETGSTGPLAGLISPLAAELRSQAQAAGNKPELHRLANFAQTIRQGLDQFAFAYEAALPVELGKATTLLNGSLQQPPPQILHRLPLSSAITTFVRTALDPISFSSPPTWKGEWKTRVNIDAQELSRQSRMIDQYFERKQLPLATGLLREWVVSWILHHQGSSSAWWSRDDRLRAERQLGALATAGASALKCRLSNDQQTWAEFWHDLSELRNTLHHHGMRKKSLETAPTTVAGIQTFWRHLKKGEVGFPSLGGGRGTLLITAIGNRPGVLYSALLAAPPRRLLVICSQQSEPMIDEAVQRARFTGTTCRILVNDPHGGFDELVRVRSEAGEFLLEADYIVANLTGGTTLMGLMAQQLVEAGSCFSRPYRRFALIDRRPPAEQDADPWVQSDFSWLDEPRGEDHADD